MDYSQAFARAPGTELCYAPCSPDAFAGTPYVGVPPLVTDCSQVGIVSSDLVVVAVPPDGEHHDHNFGRIALRWLGDREEERKAGELAPNTLISYRRTVVGVLVPALGHLHVADVRLADLRSMHAANRHRPTVANQAIDLARRILHEAEELGFRQRGSNPAGRIRHHPENAATRPATPEQVWLAFLACAEIRAGRSTACEPTCAALFQVIGATGARPSEIRTLEWPSVRLDKDPPVLQLRRHKTVRLTGEKTIVLSPIAAGVLRSLHPKHPDDPRWVFPSVANPGHPYRDIAKMWRRVADEFELGDLNLRDLRSGLATNAYNNGVPAEAIQQMLGHASFASTLRYVIISHGRIAGHYRHVAAVTYPRKKDSR